MGYAISGGHKLTVQAAEEILKAGGNAIDAAIAAFAMSWVAEPCMAGAGGGGFAMVFQPDSSPVLFDFFCQTPGKKHPPESLDFFPIEVDFGDTIETFHIGKGSTAVPGAVAGIFDLHAYAGTIPVLELFQPAIARAREGVVINAFQQYSFRLLAPILSQSHRSRQLFFRDERLIDVDEVMQLPHLSDFLEVLGHEGAALFYKGEVAQSISRDYEAGSALTLADFERYQVIRRKPLVYAYRENQLLTNPGPSLGGSVIAAIMHLLEGEDLRYHLGHQYIHAWYSILKKVQTLPQYAEHLQAFIQRELETRHGSTTHFNVVDRWGNAVSLTTTNGEGNGYFVDYTDIQLNNMLGEAALLPSGFHSWQPNQRLSSMMAPTMVINGDRNLQFVLGSGGAGRIASAIAQVLHLLIDHGLPLDEAIRAPRVHLETSAFNIEYGFKEEVPAHLVDRKVKHWAEQSLYYGGVHTLCRDGKSWKAAGDHRRDGVAALQ
jgi:gamma-glutamyltranspeptidase/glutathione hydrolase